MIDKRKQQIGILKLVVNLFTSGKLGMLKRKGFEFVAYYLNTFSVILQRCKYTKIENSSFKPPLASGKLNSGCNVNTKEEFNQ